MSELKDREDVERLKAVFLEAAAAEAERVACLLAESADEDLLGTTELELRDLVHRVGVRTLQGAANERAKKKPIKAAASPACAASRPGL